MCNGGGGTGVTGVDTPEVSVCDSRLSLSLSVNYIHIKKLD